MAGDLKKAGVELVIEGLSNFQSGMKQAGSALESLRPPQTLLQRGFEGLFNSIASFGAKVWDVVSVTLGVLLRDAIQGVINLVGELATSMLEAANDFQTFEIRLKRMNLNELTESGLDYNDAMKEAAKLTKEQLNWSIKLAAATPYDAKDITNVFTLARNYGFTADEAKGLTEQMADFAGAMGLTETHLERIIVNFGQMRQQGKLNSRDLNDLGRGAFLPINRLLELTQEELGLTSKEFEKMRASGDLGAGGVEAFILAFGELVGTDYAGGAEDLGRAFQFAVGNVKDLVVGLGGLYIVKPILDFIGEGIAKFMDAFTKSGRFDKLLLAAERIGVAIVGILQDLSGLLPGTETMADMVVTAFENIATWLEENSEDIVAFFKNVGETIATKVVPFIRDELLPAIWKFISWIIDNKEEIMQFFKDVGRTIMEDLVPFIRDNLLPALEEWGKWFFDNKELIIDVIDKFGDALLVVADEILPMLTKALEWVEDHPKEVEEVIDAWGKWQGIGTILNIVGGIIISVGGFLFALTNALQAVYLIITLVGALISSGFIVVLGALGATILWLKWLFEKMGEGIDYWKQKFQEASAIAADTMQKIENAIKNRDWLGLGKAMIQGIIDGFKWGIGTLIQAAKDAVTNAYNAAKDALSADSPSKLFFDLGIGTMEGMALGIQKAAGIAAGSMVGAMSMVTSQAVPSVTNMSQVTNTSNFNLNINSSAQTEPILQDFDMLMSLAGI